MKKILFLFLFIFTQNNLKAQFVEELTIELNLLRYTEIIGLYPPPYPYELSFVNGFNISYGQTQKISYFIGLRKVQSTIKTGGLYSSQETITNGMEYRIGAKFALDRSKVFFPTLGLEFFGEFTRIEGYFQNDYPPILELNHHQNYIGFAPSIELNLRLGKRIILFTDTRYRLGMMNLHAIESTDGIIEIYPNEKYWVNSFDLLNAIGLKFEL